MRSMLQGLVQRTWNLGDLMCRAAMERLFITVFISNSIRDEQAAMKGWAGGDPPNAETSRAPFIGPMKLLELMMDLSERFALSPAPGLTLSTKFMGGVRRAVGGDLQFLTSGSAWDQRCDALFALALNYAMDHEVRFHHVGFGHATEQEMLEATQRDEQRLGVKAVNVLAEDHIRFYLKVFASEAPNSCYWIEHQWGPGVRPNSIHWDLATTDPEHLLDFIGKPLGGQEMWGDAPNSPVGVVWQTNRDGRPFGIMARQNWWQIN